MSSKKKDGLTEEQRNELSAKLKPGTSIANWLVTSKRELLNFYHFIFLAQCILLLTMLRRWATLEIFVTTAVNIGALIEDGALITRIQGIFTNPTKKATLKLETSVVVIVFKTCVEATYLLEGDNCCSLITYEVIQRLNAWFGDHLTLLTFPDLDAVIDEAAASLNETVAQIHDRIHSIIDSAVQYFNSRINEILAEDINLYRICGMANPVVLKRYIDTARILRWD